MILRPITGCVCCATFGRDMCADHEILTANEQAALDALTEAHTLEQAATPEPAEIIQQRRKTLNEAVRRTPTPVGATSNRPPHVRRKADAVHPRLTASQSYAANIDLRRADNPTEELAS